MYVGYRTAPPFCDEGDVSLFPVELLFAAKVWIYLVFRKISKDNVLDSDIRSGIYESIMKNPGITFSALAHECGITKGRLKYHLKILEKEHKIVSLSKAGSTGYFENNEIYGDLEQVVHMHLNNRRIQEIYEILTLQPGVSRKEIAESLGISGSAVTWQMERLCADGSVDTCKDGKQVRYTLNPEAERIVKDCLPYYRIRSPLDGTCG